MGMPTSFLHRSFELRTIYDTDLIICMKDIRVFVSFEEFEEWLFVDVEGGMLFHKESTTFIRWLSDAILTFWHY